MAHINSKYLGLWKPQDLSVDKISSQKMFIDNIDKLEEFGVQILKKSSQPVASISALRAIDTSDTTLFADGTTIMVKSNGLYFFDRGNTNADNGKTIIAPTSGGGRWISDQIFFGELAFKNSLTASDVGLGNVPNVATNNQTPTYTQASSLANLISGEKLSVSMGKIMKAIADLISHLANKSNPHSVTKTQVGLGSVDNTSDADKPVSTAQSTAIADAKKAGTDAQSNLNIHTTSESNPHKVTKSQVGLGNVDNTSDINKPVSTAQASAIADAKKAGTDAQTSLSTHTANESNPHKVTKSQIGLGSVPNVATNDQVPTYTQATTLANLVSGEKLSVSMGKIMKAIADLISHLASKSNPHGVTKSQVGLGSVDNTADIDKPISTAVQTALNSKASVVNGEIATDSYQRLTGFKLLNSANLNDIKYSGQYGIASTCTNRPTTAGTYDVLEVIMYSSHWIIQRYYTIDNNGIIAGIYYRTFYSGTTWTSWRIYDMGTANTLAVAEVQNG